MRPYNGHSTVASSNTEIINRSTALRVAIPPFLNFRIRKHSVPYYPSLYNKSIIRRRGRRAVWRQKSKCSLLGCSAISSTPSSVMPKQCRTIPVVNLLARTHIYNRPSTIRQKRRLSGIHQGCVQHSALLGSCQNGSLLTSPVYRTKENNVSRASNYDRTDQMMNQRRCRNPSVKIMSRRNSRFNYLLNSVPESGDFRCNINSGSEMSHESLHDDGCSETDNLLKANYNSSALPHLLSYKAESTPEETTDEDSCGTPVCHTAPVIEILRFEWFVEKFVVFRKIAPLKNLPANDRLVSPSFGTVLAGLWHLELFPSVERNLHENVSVYLFCDDKSKSRVAEFSISIIDGNGRSIPGTTLREKATLFTPESPSWGWHEFLSIQNEENLSMYLKANGTLCIQAVVEVFSGVEELTAPRHIFDVFRAIHELEENKDTSSFPSENTVNICKSLPQDTKMSKDRFVNSVIVGVFANIKRRNVRPACDSVNSYCLNHVRSCNNLYTRKGETECDDNPTDVSITNSTVNRMRKQNYYSENHLLLHSKNKTLRSCHERRIFSKSANILFPSKLTPTTVTEDLRIFSQRVESKDIEVICSDGTRVRTSRFILAARSPVFRATLFQSSHTLPSEISLCHVCSTTAVAFIEFLENDYAGLLEMAHMDGSTCMTQSVLELLGLADFYLVPRLFLNCVKVLVRSINYLTVFDILAIGQRLDCVALVDAAKYFLNHTKAHSKIAAELLRRWATEQDSK